MGSIIQKLYQEAERKTSLGRDWHPSCLRCTKCGRVLVPGQHAEHKGNPYCQTPCYKALFGPPILGYGANLASPANFARKDGLVDFGHDYDGEVYKREIFSNRRTPANHLQRQRKSVPAVLNYEIPVSDARAGHRSCPTSPSKPSDQATSSRLRDMLQKVEQFNSHNQGKVHHQMTVEQLDNGEVRVHGPLRIYWGLSRPIQLRHCDDVPAAPAAKWRHSLYVGLSESSTKPCSPTQVRSDLRSPRWDQQMPSRQVRGIDDSVLMSPATPDDVVMRRGNIRKFKTVAYRGDAPTKWKRASINGHIFNFDTSVFTPVLGSCTSVMVDSTMTSPVVIQTLLEKFKVENSPSEYILSLVTDNEEHILGPEDRPLLELLELGAEDPGTKIFLKEQQLNVMVTAPDAAIQLPITEEEEEEETLPEEVEQLMILPVAVLTGILKKYHNDEEAEVRKVKARYERYRRRLLKFMEKHMASSTA